MFKELLRDAEICHRQRFPCRKPTIVTMAVTMLGSRGFLISLTQRMLCAYDRLAPADTLRRLQKIACWPLVHLLVYLTRIIAKAEVCSFTAVEGGVFFSNAGHLILGAKSIGSGTVINERVTIGRKLGDSGNPEIGRDVWIGKHCVIYGEITIGAGATVLPYTVLSRSVPAGAVVQGNPPRMTRPGETVTAGRQQGAEAPSAKGLQDVRTHSQRHHALPT